MERGRQSDEDRGVGQLGDEEGDDRGERAEAERQAEEGAIQQIHGDVIAQMRADVFFHAGEGKHASDSTSRYGVHLVK